MRRTIFQARFAVRRSRPGLGQGLFATADIRHGDFILEYTGRRIQTSVADTLKTRYLFEVDGTWTIDGSSRSNTARYINHSCVPNCEGEIRDGAILIYASRDIKRGEELTLDYGQEYFDEFIKPVGCKCDHCTRSRFSPQAIFAKLRLAA